MLNPDGGQGRVPGPGRGRLAAGVVRTRLRLNRREGGQVMTRQEAEAFYDAGKETAVRAAGSLHRLHTVSTRLLT